MARFVIPKSTARSNDKPKYNRNGTGILLARVDKFDVERDIDKFDDEDDANFLRFWDSYTYVRRKNANAV